VCRYTPVLVCIACMAIGWERFRWNTLILVVVATFGITLTAIGEVYSSALVGFSCFLAFNKKTNQLSHPRATRQSPLQAQLAMPKRHVRCLHYPSTRTARPYCYP
jgi:hypothetical protein